MWDIVLIWLVSAVSVVVVIYLLKSARRRRFAALANFHWPGTIVIALIIGAFPAFILNGIVDRFYWKCFVVNLSILL